MEKKSDIRFLIFAELGVIGIILTVNKKRLSPWNHREPRNHGLLFSPH
jgi:hypothetical protein